MSGAREVKTQQQWACGIAIDGSKKKKKVFFSYYYFCAARQWKIDSLVVIHAKPISFDEFNRPFAHFSISLCILLSSFSLFCLFLGGREEIAEMRRNSRATGSRFPFITIFFAQLVCFQPVGFATARWRSNSTEFDLKKKSVASFSRWPPVPVCFFYYSPTKEKTLPLEIFSQQKKVEVVATGGPEASLSPAAAAASWKCSEQQRPPFLCISKACYIVSEWARRINGAAECLWRCWALYFLFHFILQLLFFLFFFYVTFFSSLLKGVQYTTTHSVRVVWERESPKTVIFCCNKFYFAARERLTPTLVVGFFYFILFFKLKHFTINLLLLLLLPPSDPGKRSVRSSSPPFDDLLMTAYLRLGLIMMSKEQQQQQQQQRRADETRKWKRGNHAPSPNGSIVSGSYRGRARTHPHT